MRLFWEVILKLEAGERAEYEADPAAYIKSELQAISELADTLVDDSNPARILDMRVEVDDDTVVWLMEIVVFDVEWFMQWNGNLLLKTSDDSVEVIATRIVKVDQDFDLSNMPEGF